MNRSQILLATALGTTLTALLPVASYAQYDWSGPYVGASVAGIVATDDVKVEDYFGGFIPQARGGFVEFDEDGNPALFSLDEAGFGISLNAGYNIQSGNFVYGVEGDATVFANDASVAGENEGGDVFAEAEGGLDALLSLRARAGVSVDRLLLFVTAGPAVGRSSYSTSIEDVGKGTAATEYSDVALGVAVGAGVEYAITDTASIKLEGMYYHFGDLSVDSTGELFGPSYTATSNPSSAVVRVGVNVGF